MNEKLKVTFRVTASIVVDGECEMTREDYDQWCKRLENGLRAEEQERSANALMTLAGVDILDGDIDDFEVEDFSASS